MSIEQTLERIAVALEALAGTSQPLTGGSVDTAPAKSGRGKKSNVDAVSTTDAPAEPKAATKPVVEEPADDAIPYDTVSAKTLELVKGKSKDIAMGVLKKFGAATARDLKPNQYQAYIDAVDDALFV